MLLELTRVDVQAAGSCGYLEGEAIPRQRSREAAELGGA